MNQKLGKIVGLSKSDFDFYMKEGEISARKASLIPIYKFGDEMALSSVILSSLRLIREFRKEILTVAKMARGGTVFVYNEVVFKQYPDSRVDGMLLVVSGGIIKDAAIFEMKNGNNELDQAQIDKYVDLAKKCNIPRLITISNQFVSDPLQSPVNIRNTNSFAAYHFSWTYLLTVAHILLFDNETNIADQDQVEIMKEVVRYLEEKKSGVCGFTQMKPGWKTVVEKINSGSSLKIGDTDVEDTIVSWFQEEKDLSLILSRKLGLLVQSGENRYKGKLKNRIEDTKKSLLLKYYLSSVLRVKGAVSDIRISAFFKQRIVTLSVSLLAPRNKKTRGQISWIMRQLENCQKRGGNEFDAVKDEIKIDVLYKNTSKYDRMGLRSIESIYDDIKGREIKEFRVVQIKDFGKNFASRNKFVDTIELMLEKYYKAIVQHLVKWEPPAPKIRDQKTDGPIPDKNEEDSEIDGKTDEHDEHEKYDKVEVGIEHNDNNDWPDAF